MRDGDLNCVAQRVFEHFEGALRVQGLTPTGCGRYKTGRRESMKRSTLEDVTGPEKIMKRAIILRDMTGEDIVQHRQILGE